MNDDVARAHALLKEGTELLERHRQQVVVPVQKRSPAIDPKTLAQQTAKIIRQYVAKSTAPLLDRIDALEREVERLKSGAPMEAEWPLPVGGERDAA